MGPRDKDRPEDSSSPGARMTRPSDEEPRSRGAGPDPSAERWGRRPEGKVVQPEPEPPPLRAVVVYFNDRVVSSHDTHEQAAAYVQQNARAHYRGAAAFGRAKSIDEVRNRFRVEPPAPEDKGGAA